MDSVFIRDYKPEDYPQVEKLWEATGLGGKLRGDTQEVIERSLTLGGRLIIAENSHKAIVGTSWITYDGRRLHLHHLGVLPSFQRKGIGKMLTLESIAFARKTNIQIKLEVHRTNRGAINLYTSLGFDSLGDYQVYIIRNLNQV